MKVMELMALHKKLQRDFKWTMEIHEWESMRSQNELDRQEAAMIKFGDLDIVENYLNA